jgi:dolichyl-phosphate beta-glucosyltransferase
VTADPELSVVVPVFNEQRIIRETVRRIGAYFDFIGQAGEILIVNDGSTDRTAAALEGAPHGTLSTLRVLTAKTNSGKGFAVRRGALEARGRQILVTDADLSTPLKEVEKLQAALAAGADVAIGSRAIPRKEADVQQSFKRHLSGRIFNTLVQTLLLPGFHDTQCGFKLFTAPAARALFPLQQMIGFSFDVEILYLARKQGLRIAEVPVMWKQGATSQVNLFRDSTRMVRDLFIIKKKHG